MNEELAKCLDTDFDHWVTSPDESKVVAWKNQGKNAVIFDTETGEKILSIDAEMDKWYWSPNGNELVSHDYITTCIWDATTGKFLRSVEAMYDRPDE
jgi:WD40 repeat protein